MKTKLYNTEILGISSVVPQKELSLLDEKNLYNGNEKKLKRVINSSGFLKRRIVNSSTTTSDLCKFAAKNLFENLNINPKEIDALIFISYTPDYLMPATSYVLQKELNLSQECICMDIPQACSGFVIGLFQASALINSGAKKVLLLVGDTFSKFSDMFKDNSAPVFGDAGSAILLQQNKNTEPMYFNLKSCGEKYSSLICKNGGFRNPVKKEDFYEDGSYKYEAKMQGAEIFNFTIEEISPSIEELFNYSEISKDEIDYFAFHQANKFIIENIALQLNINENKVLQGTLSKYGNQCGASIPCLLSETLNENLSNNKYKMLFSGFGVGLSWASAIVDLKNIYCSKILTYEDINE